jgi:murein DD-endopeptidase MepM/ murein hydrolase activator NlpD
VTRKALGGIIASVISLVVACAAGVALLFGGGVAAGCTIPPPSGPVPAPADGWRPLGRFDAEQVGHAATIAAVGAQKGVAVRGWVIAVATAIQESNLRNLAGGPDDSIGLFQQRPSQGWGTPTQLRDPVYAAGKFYDKLLTVPGWRQMPLTEAAQAVQRSAYPDAYAKHEPDATRLVNTTISGAAEACAPISPGGWVMPVDGPIVSAFRPADRPGHDGIDIAAARGTTIHAASAGTVTLVRCNASLNGAPYPCDHDGSPGVAGCGWYTEITHPGNIITRYCHQLHRPPVSVGQHVKAGQPIGVVGTSGHSSGPHLHFETHTGTPASEANAVDPAAFLRSVGVTLR